RKSRRSNLPTTQRRKVIWASQPFRGRLGAYIGIALETYRLSVAIHTPAGPRWVPVPEALPSLKPKPRPPFGSNPCRSRQGTPWSCCARRKTPSHSNRPFENVRLPYWTGAIARTEALLIGSLYVLTGQLEDI